MAQWIRTTGISQKIRVVAGNLSSRPGLSHKPSGEDPFKWLSLLDLRCILPLHISLIPVTNPLRCVFLRIEVLHTEEHET